MKQVHIERLVIDEGCFESGDVESLRERLQNELTTLLEKDGLPDTMQSTTRVDGGQLPSSSPTALPRMIAEQVVRSLGGKS